MVTEIEQLKKRHGTVPPPWVYAPDEHPYSIFWRMGGGESLVMVWGAWWKSQALNEAQRIAYFRQFPPQPRWLDWMLDAIWDLPLPEEDEDEATFDRTPYFQRVEALGFGTRKAYERDLEDLDPLVPN